MSEEILEAFKKLKSQLDVRDYDDERFIKDLPENEPVSLVIPFERTGRGYLDIFRSYIGGDEHPELSDEELLKQYLESEEGKTNKVKGDIYIYNHPNYFKGYIEEYESDYLGNKNIFGYPAFNRNRFSAQEVTKLIQTLKKQGINAVEKQDQKSQDPSTVVVMNNGIMTPFMDKKTINSLMPKIKKAMSSCGFAVGGHIAPVTFEQLRSPFGTELVSEKKDFMKSFLYDLSKQPSLQISEIKNLEQLTTSTKKIKVSHPTELGSIDIENDKEGRPYIWRGGTLGDKAFIANIDTESKEAHVLRKSWAMATPSLEYAREYSSARSEKFAGYRFGFLYQYDTFGKEAYLPDRGIERQPGTAVLPFAEETPLFSNKHSLKNIFFYCGRESEQRFFMIRLDENNPIHKQLLKLYEPKEGKLSENLLQRRINQFNEAAENGGKPLSYTSQIENPHSAGIMKRLSKGMEEGKNMNQNGTSKNNASTAQRMAIISQHPQH